MNAELIRARRLVVARLGREPQDALEAAVVLEAWAGVPAQRALETARGLMSARPAESLPSSAAPATPQPPSGLLRESAAFLVTVVAIALWAEPLSDALGVDAVERALRLALPLTLGFQWALLSRHLGRPSGLAGLAGRTGALAAGAVAIVALPALLMGPAGTLAGLLTVTWTGGSIVIRRGWAATYCAAVVAAVPAMLLGTPPLVVVAAVASVTVLATAWALRTASAAASVPGRWSRTLGIGLTGAGIGVLLVGDPTIGWTGGAAPALALLPSAAGAVWAGQHLWKLAGAFPRALAGVPACVASRHPASRGGQPTAAGALRPVTARAVRPPADGASPRAVRPNAWPTPFVTLLGAVARLAALTLAGSAALLVLGGEAGVLAGFGIVALATLLVGLLDSLGRPSLAAVGVAGGLAGELLVRLADAPFSGAPLLAGGAVAVLVLLPGALVLLARPARTLATALWIT